MLNFDVQCPSVNQESMAFPQDGDLVHHMLEHVLASNLITSGRLEKKRNLIKVMDNDIDASQRSIVDVDPSLHIPDLVPSRIAPVYCSPRST